MLSFFILSVAIKYSFADDIQSVKFHLRRAHEYILKENYEDAEKEYREALRLDPNCLDAASGLNALGFRFIQLGFYEKAINNLQDALEVFTLEKTSDDYGNTQKNLIVAYGKLSEVKDKEYNLKLSLKACDEALKVFTPEKFPQDYGLIKFNQGNAHLELAEIKDKELDLNLSVKAFEEALKTITPKESPLPYAQTNYFLSKAYFMLSKVKDKETNLEHAIKYLQEYLNLRAEFPLIDVRKAYKIMGYMLSELGQHDEATKEYREALRLRPDAPDAPEIHFSLGNALKGQEKYVEAEIEYREAIRLRPNYVAAYVHLGNTLQALNFYKFEESKYFKRFEEAEKAYLKAIELKSDSFEAHYNLGFLLYDLARYPDAEKEYRKALNIRPNFANAHFYLGYVLIERKNFNDAENEFRTTLSLDRDHLNARSARAFLLIKRGSYGEAEKEFTEILESKYLKALCPDYKGIRDLNLLLKELVWEEESGDKSKKMQKVAAKILVVESLFRLSEIKAMIANKTGEASVFQDALGELDGALTIAKTSPDHFRKRLLDMYLRKGNIYAALGDYNEAKQVFEECKGYDRDNPEVKRYSRRIDDIMFWQWIWKIIFLTAPVGIILYSFAFLKYFRFRESKSKYVKLFYIGIFVFISVVILELEILPSSITKSVKYIGKLPITFDPSELPIQSIKKAMREEWMARLKEEMEWGPPP